MWGQVGTCQIEVPGEPVSASQFDFLDVHSSILDDSHLQGSHRLPQSYLGPRGRGKKNPSTLHKQLISLLGRLGSSNVIIILTKALASVRGISTTAADTIIKAPAFLCSTSCTERFSRDLLRRETPRLGCVPLVSSESCQEAPLTAGSRVEPWMWLPSAYSRPEQPREGLECYTGDAPGRFPETSQGGIYLGEFPSLWQTAGRFGSLILLAHPAGSHLLGEYSR